MLVAAPARAGTGVLVDDGHRITSRGTIGPDDRFRVGSVTKTFTAVVVLQLEAERRIIRPLHLERTAYDEGPRVSGVVPGFVGETDVSVQNTSWAGASGALVSSARDLARFYGSLHKLLPRRQLAAMHTGSYGLGLFPLELTCGVAWGHNGAVAGYFTNAFTRGAKSAVVLVNQYPTDEPRALRKLNAALCS
jgi:D-alanyl-D-alanine carboxypeptidase